MSEWLDELRQSGKYVGLPDYIKPQLPPAIAGMMWLGSIPPHTLAALGIDEGGWPTRDGQCLPNDCPCDKCRTVAATVRA